MREAGAIAKLALIECGKAVAPGVTTRELDEIARKVIKQCGATPSFLGYQGYPAAICCSINDTVIHGIPGKDKIREGDIVSIDVGAFYRGYHGDNADTFAAGIIAPVYCGDSVTLRGIEMLLHEFKKIFPSAEEVASETATDADGKEVGERGKYFDVGITSLRFPAGNRLRGHANGSGKGILCYVILCTKLFDYRTYFYIHIFQLFQTWNCLHF